MIKTFIVVSSLSVAAANGAITLTVSGGLNSPLMINISQAAGLVATTNSSGDAFLVFQGFWNNTASGIGTTTDTTAQIATIGINGTTNTTHTGSVQTSGFNANDLIIGFVTPTLVNTQAVTINLGTRTTTNNLALNYTTSGVVTGDVLIVNASGGALTTTTSYTGTIDSVPEPSSTTLLGLGGLALILRRRK